MGKTTPPCAACKYLRRKCTEECVFAPYFPTNKQAQYISVHKVFGASHVATLINDITPNKREFAMNTLAFEAQARIVDPVYGCTAIIYHLECQLKDVLNELAIVRKQLASYKTVPPLPPTSTYQEIHDHPVIPASSNNYEGFLMTQLLRDEAQRFASTQNAQMQQTQEVQKQDNETAMRGENILSKI